jgi:RHS repeat-associated protein
LSQVVGTATLPYLFGFDLAFPGQKRDRETGKHYNYFRDYDPAVGRYTESDPIGLRGGISTFGYVAQKPTLTGDPSGLVEWNGGYAAYAGFVPTVGKGLVGRGLLFFSLSSPCVRGQQWHVKVSADASYFAFGFPFSIVGSSVTLEDGLDWVNPYVFNGGFSLWSFGAAFGGGYGYTDMKVGGARTKGYGAYGGIDGYAAIASGTSWVTDARPSKCCEK